MNLNDLDYRVTFYSQESDGPEAGMFSDVEVYSCWADMYEPTQKDVQLGNLQTSKKAITLNIRNAYPQFVPHVNQIFKFQNGLYKDLTFNIKHIAVAKTPHYLKVGAEEV